MPFEDAADYRFNSSTSPRWLHKDTRTIPIGRMVLTAIPITSSPRSPRSRSRVANFVPGIGPSPDRMVLGRMFAYADSNRYRTGPNYLQLPINKPINEVHSYNKDGPMRYHHNGNQPVYAPNSHGGLHRLLQRYRDPSWFVEAADIMRRHGLWLTRTTTTSFNPARSIAR